MGCVGPPSNSSLDLPSGPFFPTPANTAMPGQKELFIPGTPKSQGEGLLLDIKQLISISLYLHFMYLVYLVFTSCVCVCTEAVNVYRLI